ncbi:MAG: hyperosmotically inducible periplasmic protein [Massilia sp.]|jgi:hyperosmotically inducible protein|nr:hyperosmotically inducible periplasmic protein [Massilia sp.]
MQRSKLMHSAAAIALLAGTMTMSFTAGAAGQQTPAAPAAAAGAAPAAAVNDEAITATAKAAISADAQLAGLPINVATKQGVVVVSGVVPSAAAGDRVLQLVASVSGVKDVKNTLKVKSS